MNLLIEAGHGKKSTFGIVRNDPGAVRVINGFQWTERNLAQGFARFALQALEGKVKAYPIGVDTDATIQRKAAYANEVIRKAGLNPNETLYVAIHVNSGGGTGGEIFYKHGSAASKKVAEKVLMKYCKWTGLKERGVKDSRTNRHGRLYIDDVVCPAILIETGFIDSPDLETLKDSRKVGQGIAHALL